MTQYHAAQPESRASKRLLMFVIGSMLITFLLGVFTVVWIGLHVLDARHDLVPDSHAAATTRTANAPPVR